MIRSEYELKVIKPGILIRDRFGSILDARSTVTLIQSDDLKIIVDTGLSSEKERIIESLEKINLLPDDINNIILTHSHIDHTGNIKIFKNAKVFSHQNEPYDNKSINNIELKGDIIDILPGINIIETPGHSRGSISVLVNGKMAKFSGTFALTGDALPIMDNFIKWVPPGINFSAEIALRSMKKIVNIAEYIVPGHDKPFRIIDLKNRVSEYLF